MSDAAPTGSYTELVHADSPSGYWRFGERSGTVALDERGKVSGQYIGSVVLGVPGAIASDPDSAAEFHGGSMSLGDSFGFLEKEEFTIELWLKIGEVVAFPRVIAKISDDTDQGWIAFLADDTLCFYRVGGNITTASDAVKAAITRGVWHHMVVTFDGALLALYLDGVLVESNPATANIGATPNPLSVASESNFSNWYDGAIDELALYAYALPQTRVQAHYRRGTGK